MTDIRKEFVDFVVLSALFMELGWIGTITKPARFVLFAFGVTLVYLAWKWALREVLERL